MNETKRFCMSIVFYGHTVAQIYAINFNHKTNLEDLICQKLHFKLILEVYLEMFLANGIRHLAG